MLCVHKLRIRVHRHNHQHQRWSFTEMKAHSHHAGKVKEATKTLCILLANCVWEVNFTLTTYQSPNQYHRQTPTRSTITTRYFKWKYTLKGNIDFVLMVLPMKVSQGINILSSWCNRGAARGWIEGNYVVKCIYSDFNENVTFIEWMGGFNIGLVYEFDLLMDFIELKIPIELKISTERALFQPKPNPIE